MSLSVLLALTWSSVGGVEPDRNSQAELTKAWLAVSRQRAVECRIVLTGNGEEELRLLQKPVLYHNQPVRGDDIGAVWLWVQEDGRPAVIGAIFAFSTSRRDGSRTVFHEMHSLAAVPITAVYQEETQPVKGAFAWKPIPDAPEPASSSAGRLQQMRLLSRRFRAHSIDSQGRRWELRLIPRPLYDYELKNDDSALGGALLAFCQGTDTEIVLAFEARQTANGYRWHFGCADFSDYGLYVRLDDAEVWSSPRGYMSGLKWTSKFYQVKLPEDDQAVEVE
jgi:hypothetical protein